MQDPVCGMEVSEPPVISLSLNHQTYGFCNLSCREKFKANPSAYLNSKHHFQQMDETRLRDFLPLVIVFAVILIFSFGTELYCRNWELMRWMRNFMASFFLIFGSLKLLNWSGFVEAYQTYDILAKRSVLYARAYPFIELGLGLAYLFKQDLAVVNIVTLIVMSLSSVGVAQALLKKQKIQCACLGVIFKIPMTKITLLEDILMGVMALIMLIYSSGSMLK